MNTPNKITLSRLILIPIIVFFYLADFIPYSKLVSAVVFMVACLTDFLDGYLARKNNQVTTLGKFFDTIADKVLIMTGLLLITTAPIIDNVLPVTAFGGPSWVALLCTIIILAREFIVSSLRQIAAVKGVVLAADMGGKIKATLQFIVVSLYMTLAFVVSFFKDNIADTGKLNNGLSITGFILMILLIITTLLTIYSGASYLIRNRHVFSENKEDEEIAKEIIEEENKRTESSKIENMDALLPQALYICIENGFASTIVVQQKLSIGYPRAARIIDQMEELGYISDSTEGRQRQVLISKEEFIKIYGDNFR